MSNVQKSTSVSNRAEEKEGLSIPSFIGANLAEFSITPLPEHTNTPDFLKRHPLGKPIRYEWQDLVDGSPKDFYFQVTYQKTDYNDRIPNCYVEDAIILLSHLANQADDPLRVPFTLYKLHRLKGLKHNQSGNQIEIWKRYFDSLRATDILSNYIYDFRKKKFVTLSTSVLASYEYIDEEGTLRSTPVLTWNKDDERFDRVGELVTDQRVLNLETFSFSPGFYDHFVKPLVPLDVALYIALRSQYSKRIYTYAAKYAHLFPDGHSVDLKQFCRTNLRMSEPSIDNVEPYNLASKIRSYANRVNSLAGDQVRVSVLKSKTASGYVVSVERGGVKVVVSSIPFKSTLTTGEAKAYNALLDIGLYQNVAQLRITEARELFGPNASDYINFVITTMRHRQKTGEVKAKGKKAFAGTVGLFLNRRYFKAEFEEHLARGRKVRREPSGVKLLSEILVKDLPKQPVTSKTKLTLPAAFSLTSFEKQCPLVVQSIARATERKYQLAYEGMRSEGLNISKKMVERDAARAFLTHCKNAYSEFMKGNLDYFPEDILEYRNTVDG